LKYKLVVSDIDGTLLSDENILLPSTEKTIRELVDLGVLFATVSARTISYTEYAISTFKDVCCANAYVNGAFVEASNGAVLLDSPLEDEDTSFLIEKLNHARASFCCISKDNAIASLTNPDVSKGFKLHHGTFIERAIIDTPPLNTYLIAAEAKDMQSVVDAAARHRLDIEMSPIVQSPMTGLKVSFFQKKGTSKAAAMRSIAECYGVDLSDTIAIGDSTINDTPMIEEAGCGVAMKNSSKALFSKAKTSTEKDNNEDGVGVFLRRLFGL
jgi:Cof subfamily protein (haloacid dehalogenase superfamily)